MTDGIDEIVDDGPDEPQIEAPAFETVDFTKQGGRLNTDTDQMISNVIENIMRPLPQLQIYQPQDREMLILAGGPSMKENLGTIVGMMHSMNCATLCVNGAYGFMVDQGYDPGIMAMLDARPWNIRFLHKRSPGTKFFLASQVDPSCFDYLIEQGVEPYIWHAPVPCPDDEDPDEWEEGRDLYRRHYLEDKNYLIVPGGVTVTAKSIMMAYWLGFRKIHMFGFDSCWMGEEHHSYEQPENNDKRVRFWFHGDPDDRKFICAPWMAHQASSFFQLAANLPENLKLKVWGDGLIAYGLKQIAAGVIEARIDDDGTEPDAV